MKNSIKMQKSPVKIKQGKRYANLNQSYLNRLELYNSAKWKAVRKGFLRGSPTCCRCGAPAEIVDHKKGHHIGKDKYGKTWKDYFWEVDNFQSMCWSCHSRKTCLEDMKNKPKRMTAKDRVKQLKKLKEK